jgi:hypothetical protein
MPPQHVGCSNAAKGRGGRQTVNDLLCVAVICAVWATRGFGDINRGVGAVIVVTAHHRRAFEPRTSRGVAVLTCHHPWRLTVTTAVASARRRSSMRGANSQTVDAALQDASNSPPQQQQQQHACAPCLRTTCVDVSCAHVSQLAHTHTHDRKHSATPTGTKLPHGQPNMKKPACQLIIAPAHAPATPCANCNTRGSLARHINRTVKSTRTPQRLQMRPSAAFFSSCSRVPVRGVVCRRACERRSMPVAHHAQHAPKQSTAQGARHIHRACIRTPSHPQAHLAGAP